MKPKRMKSNLPVRRSVWRWRVICSLSLTYTLVLSLAGVPAAFSQSDQSDSRPGKNDPARNYFSLASHGLGTFAPGDNRIAVQGYSSDAGLSLTQVFSYDQPADADQIVAASGRIWSPDREQVVYARRWRGGSQLHVVFVNDPPTNQASHIFNDLAPRLPLSADFMDIAAGDLDKVPDSAGNLHDEVVVAYVGPGVNNQMTVNVAVLDYTAPATAPPVPAAVTSATASHTIDGNNFATAFRRQAILPVDNVLGVAVGDFDGDGPKEIAVAHIENYQRMWVTTFRYTNDGRGGRSLKEVSSTSVGVNRSAPDNYFAGSVDVAAGDVDGKGGDELIESHTEWVGEEPFPGEYRATQNVALNVFQGDGKLNLHVRARRHIFANGGDNPTRNDTFSFGDFSSRTRVQISPGLFKYDPRNGFDLNRRQLAVAWNTPISVFSTEGATGIRVAAFEVSSDLSAFAQQGNQLVWQAGYFPYPEPINQRFSIAAGAYRSNSTVPPPLWGIALGALHANGEYVLSTLNVASGGVSFIQQQSVGRNLGFQALLPVVAYDLDGKSVNLGAPVHFLLEDVVNTDFALQEPPKHAFYDNRPTIDVNGRPVPNPTYGQVVTVSRYDETNVALRTSQGTTFSGTSKDSSDWTIGGSVEASAGATISGGFPGLAKASASIDVTAKVGYDYNQKKESYNSNYHRRTITQTERTDRDDKLVGRMQTVDVWRYRVYGVAVNNPEGQPTNAFYEVVLPGPTTHFSGGGLNFDSYQPTYENGNILSYPRASSSTFTPPDLGEHRIPCPSPVPPGQQCNADGTLTVGGPLVPARQIFFDGTSGTLAYDYQNTTGSGNSFGYSHKLAESLDVKVGVKAKATTPFVSGEARASLDVEMHNSNSWGSLRTSDNSTTSETGITLNRSAGDSTQAYAFYPVFYTTADGTIKVAHAVDVLASATGRAFWAGVYGRKADPALNLPSRFTPVYGQSGALSGWAPNYQSTRKRMRGFFVRKAELNPVTNTYDLLASNPLAGEKVRVEARVYNYSTAVAFNNLKVRFQVIGYDSGESTEVKLLSCPDGTTPQDGRCTIGETTIQQMSPLQMTTAAITWNTTGYGPASALGKSEYRVYVVLDPDNTIDETYEAEDPDTDYPCKDGSGNPCSPALPQGVDPGQNNEGYGLVAIQHPSLSADEDADFDSDAHLRKNSLALADSRGRLHFDHALAQVDRPVMLRAAVYSDRTNSSQSHLLVYDGDPEKGGETIAEKIVHGGDKRGSYVWFEWIPTRLGKHTLHAKVVEKSDDPHKGNNTDTLEVRVVPADTKPPQLAVTLSPNVLQPPDDRMVPITATIFVKDDHGRRPEIKLEAITHNEANDAAEDVAGAEFGTDDRRFRLRAKHSGRRRDSRVYTVVYSATDWAGNKTFTKAYVLVPGRRQR